MNSRMGSGLSVADPAAVPDAVAAVLGIIQQPGTSVSESVAAALEGRIRLLVIDNCEHVLDAAADLIEAILAQVTHEMPLPGDIERVQRRLTAIGWSGSLDKPPRGT
jgi:hypothetical protein